MRPALAIVVLAAGCAAQSGNGSDAGSPMPDLAPSNALVAARPYQYLVPSGYDASKPAPLVILLHGYGVNGVLQDAVYGFSSFADANGILYAFPDGTVDAMGMRFWNATDACCDFGHTGVDDVAYLSAVVDDMKAHFAVDEKRIYFIGHSNGGFMSHRMACDRAGMVAAIVPLAGDDWKDVSMCKPSEPVAVAQVHGDADMEVAYGGSSDEPSAMESVAGWAMLNGCGATPDTSAPPIDLDTQLPGAETSFAKWPCPKGAAELWTIHGAGHVPHFAEPAWPQAMWTFLSAHPKE